MTVVGPDSTYIHVVKSVLRSDATEEEIENLLDSWRRMGESIDAVDLLWVGRQGSADSPAKIVIAVSRFANESNWSEFMAHEKHLEFGKIARTIVEPGGVSIAQFHPI